MCLHNDSYEQNIEEFTKYVSGLNLPPKCRVADIGAGTGNFICQISKVIPYAEFTHVDSNREMNQIALKKYDQYKLPNVRVIEDDIQRLDFPDHEFDLIVCVNALYAMVPQDLVLRKMRDWLKPNGVFYVIDLGREMKTVDWGVHFLRTAYKQRRLLAYLNDAFLRGREVLRQNRLTTIAQNSGRYWMHETASFGEQLLEAGFEIERLEPCYRGYADLAICRSPHASPA